MTREAKFAHNFVQAVVFKSDKCKMSDKITKYAEYYIKDIEHFFFCIPQEITSK